MLYLRNILHKQHFLLIVAILLATFMISTSIVFAAGGGGDGGDAGGDVGADTCGPEEDSGPDEDVGDPTCDGVDDGGSDYGDGGNGADSGNGGGGDGGGSGSGGGGGASNPSFGGSPAIIMNGNSTDLTWACVGSSSSSSINFSTGGATSGTSTVSPTSTTQYTVICSNGGQSSVTVTVLDPSLSIAANPVLLQSGNTSEITWTATSVNSCTVGEDNGDITDSWGGTSGTQTTSAIEQETVYTLSCETDGGTATASATVSLVPIFQEF